MAFAFRRETPVLHFGPRLPKGTRWSERRFLLWPALLYRVVAPEVRERRLNVLQKAVLGMCRAGTMQAQRIGELLHIHPDLAALVYVELRDRGLLDGSGRPTQQGRDLFEDETLESHRMVTGHVFQDPATGALWPRFVEKLDYVELQHDEQGFPELVLGTTGEPRRRRALMCRMGDVALPAAPSALDIVAATRRHRRAMRSVDSYELADEDDRPSRASGAAIERVSLVDDQPTPVYLTTFVYLPEDGGGDWNVCDPFGFGTSPVLRRSLDRELQTSTTLRSVLESMLARSLDEQIEARRRWAAEVRAEAVLRIDRALSVNARDLPQYPDLLDMEDKYVEAQMLGQACPQQTLRELLGAARRVLEGTLRAIADQYSPRDVWRRLYAHGRPIEDRRYVAEIYDASARAVGFSVPLPRALADVPPNHVKAAGYADSWRLRGAIVAAVLAARDNRGHPLRGAAAAEPDLLSQLDAVARAAGEAVHGGGDVLVPEIVFAVIDTVHRSIGLLTGLAASLPTGKD